jgi:hypothetical protein
MNEATIQLRLEEVTCDFAKEDFDLIECRLRQFRFHSSLDYKSSAAWKQKRLEMKVVLPFQCYVCESKGPYLHLHHRTYSSICDEQQNDLCWLCKRCHFKAHKNVAIAKRFGLVGNGGVSMISLPDSVYLNFIEMSNRLYYFKGERAPPASEILTAPGIFGV